MVPPRIGWSDAEHIHVPSRQLVVITLDSSIIAPEVPTCKGHLEVEWTEIMVCLKGSCAQKQAQRLPQWEKPGKRNKHLRGCRNPVSRAPNTES